MPLRNGDSTINKVFLPKGSDSGRWLLNGFLIRTRHEKILPAHVNETREDYKWRQYPSFWRWYPLTQPRCNCHVEVNVTRHEAVGRTLPQDQLGEVLDQIFWHLIHRLRGVRCHGGKRHAISMIPYDPMLWANPKASKWHSLDPKQNNGSQLFTTSGQALGDRFQSCPWRSPPEAMHIRVVRRPSSSWRPLTCRLASGSCLEWSVSGVEVISCKGYQIVYEDEGGLRNPSWFCKTWNSHIFPNSHQPT